MSQNRWSRFRSVIPKRVQVASALIAGAAVITGSVVIFLSGAADAQKHRTADHGSLDTLLLVSFCTLAVLILAAILLGAGYVYGDAKRRGMPAGLWTLLVVSTPNMIGFLLYFALRKPLLAACPHCGAGINSEQRFCASCGAAQNPSGPTSPAGAPPISSTPAPSQPSSGISLKSFATGFSVWTGIFLSKAMFAYLHHEGANSVGLLALASVGVALLIFAHLKPTPAR